MRGRVIVISRRGGHTSEYAPGRQSKSHSVECAAQLTTYVSGSIDSRGVYLLVNGSAGAPLSDLDEGASAQNTNPYRSHGHVPVKSRLFRRRTSVLTSAERARATLEELAAQAACLSGRGEWDNLGPRQIVSCHSVSASVQIARTTQFMSPCHARL